MSRHLVDRELTPFLDMLPPVSLNADTLPDLRRMMVEAPSNPAPAAPNVSVEDVFIDGPVGNRLRVRIYRPDDRNGPLPALLHIHGGGLVAGSPESAEARNRWFAHDIGCVVASVDYRLAPETPFPGPLEDCYTALLWLHTQADPLGVDRARIAIGGQSAGGGLAAALALLARERAVVPICFQLLIYPMLDNRTGSTAGTNQFAGAYVWTAADNCFAWKAYLGSASSAESVPLMAPARADDLSGLPPAHIGVGSLDLFVDECIDYAHRLIRAGVSTALHVYPGAFHGFDMFPGTEIKEQFDRDYHEALRRALHPAGVPGTSR